MTELEHLLQQAAAAGAAYRAGLAKRSVTAAASAAHVAQAFGGPLPEAPSAPAEVLADLVAAAEPGLVATAGPRYFGFVIGGSVDAAVAADVVATGWDQVAFSEALSPAASAVEAVAGGWLKELLGVPSSATVGFVTGAQAANTVGLAAGRHAVLAKTGWDVERQGLIGAPPLRVLAGDEYHTTIGRSLRLLGLGTDVIELVATDTNGAMLPGELERVLAAGPASPAIVCLQAGNVNTGACDPLRAGCEVAHGHGAWAHVDGAFGLWAAASPSTRHLVDGVELADSWGCDGHKWLNVPYDSAFVFCADPEAHAGAVSFTASYLGPDSTAARLANLTLESSRRARGFAVWAAIRQLGRSGVAELVERCCRLARRFAEGLAAGGVDIANEVVLNQVLAGFGDDERTARVIDGVQRDGTCWMGGTVWRGRHLMRISVSNWSTTEADVDRSVEAILRVAASA